MRGIRPAVLGLALALAAATGCSSSGSDSHPARPASDAWRLVWSDEFDGAAGTRPNPGKWGFDLGGEPSWGNSEWEYYTDRPQNASLDGSGHLAVTARRETLPGMAPCPEGTCDITSARLNTKDRFAQKYGRFEARIRIPSGQGIWPAFWMLGADIERHPWPANGEIDVMEILGSDPATLYGTAHAPGFGDKGMGGSTRLPDGAALSDAFHTYAVEWAPDRITWSLDGTPYFALDRASLPEGRTWVFDHGFFLLLNLAVGGEWPGPPDDTTVFPATMLVDYVRVYGR
ncbi:glycoside hydrolase family 16 protein [Yinghuangia seranimata]|uniref:glycoside hydrolase family 16 protein n=1 Tax=Yinghuangia seranimata TaxID=408067 RepID=UPI00248B7DD3|nr:glycoside hydrolase family 16 protein [Yinghuangia seranimata]MDI2125648.1 glycoside hydrolase family 16 protein [Yinghuangia seranimata]